MKEDITHRDFLKPQTEIIEAIVHIKTQRQPIRQSVNFVSIQFIKNLNVAESIDKIPHIPSISGL
jgi:hypothetical protein